MGDPPDGAATSPQPYFGGHRLTYPMTIAQVAQVNAKRAAASGDPWTQKGQLQLHGRGVDHPFHIHQNPFWLMRIDVPDQNGDYVNTLPQTALGGHRGGAPEWRSGRVPISLRRFHGRVRGALPPPPARGQRHGAATPDHRRCGGELRDTGQVYPGEGFRVSVPTPPTE